MGLSSLLVANRGEIAVRIMRAAGELGIRTVAVYSRDDAASLHTRWADEAVPLELAGPRAYLDAAEIVRIAQEYDCDAVHPGYGFLSESAALAERCAANGVVFVGPRADTLALLGNKAEARALARRLGVPVLAGTGGKVTLDEARDFLAAQGSTPVMIKAVHGGGGRGVRVVGHRDELADAWARCESEAAAAFGNGELYLERLMANARHIEVQIVGDGTAVSHLWERECSLQRRFQKLVEVAPSPGLDPELRDRLLDAAVRLAEETRYESLGTFEFLVDALPGGTGPEFAFIEANPRLQVEHTVTEEVTGVDLVKLQLRLAAGESLSSLGRDSAETASPQGFAMQVRINLETMRADGSAKPSGGTLTAFGAPSGPGLRTDSFGYTGYATSPSFDALLAKLIAHSRSPDFTDVVTKAYRGLCEFEIAGVETNLPFLRNLLCHPDVRANRVHTRFVEEHAAEIVAGEDTVHRQLFFGAEGVGGARQPSSAVLDTRSLAGARIDSTDPLAVLDHGKSDAPPVRPAELAEVPSRRDAPEAAPAGALAVASPMQGTVVSIAVREGDAVSRGEQLLVMEAMKMEHVIEAPTSGIVIRLGVREGDPVFEGHALVFLEARDVPTAEVAEAQAVDLDRVRPDLEEVYDRHAIGLDAARPAAVARRRKTGQRTARENIEDLCDPGTFTEYGPIVIAAQRRRRSLDDLIAATPADGMIAGVGSVNGERFAGTDVETQTILMSYDYTVLAGTQGAQNHRKKDRMFALAEQWRVPVVFFTEGGGGRPGDTDGIGGAGLDCFAFHYFGKLSGLVPLVGINSGRCFAGNAALLGCCDVIIATQGSNIGMGGPAMIEGGGLGIFRPEEVGPMDVQVPNGVVDIAVEDEAEAVRVAKEYLSYFQGALPEWECADQRLLRGIIPENRLRIYNVRSVIETLADAGSVLELRRSFGLGMVTALARIEGRPIGVIANNPTHLAGAIDSDGADKATRFMQLCDAFDIPILLLCDTPGIMVGPEVEKTALVRHASRMFVTSASLSVPYFTIVLRKGYGLGAQAMAGGSFRAPMFTVSWPTGEFGGMGLEGAVKLGFRKELAAIEDPKERKALFDTMVERMYRNGKAVNTASLYEIDDVIDPVDSRRWILSALRSAPAPDRSGGKKRPCVDTW